jgi:hypothetical protein
MSEQVPTWTLRGRGEHHAPELNGPYLPHNETITVEASKLPAPRAQVETLWTLEPLSKS